MGNVIQALKISGWFFVLAALGISTNTEPLQAAILTAAAVAAALIFSWLARKVAAGSKIGTVLTALLFTTYLFSFLIPLGAWGLWSIWKEKILPWTPRVSRILCKRVCG